MRVTKNVSEAEALLHDNTYEVIYNKRIGEYVIIYLYDILTYSHTLLFLKNNAICTEFKRIHEMNEKDIMTIFKLWEGKQNE